MGRYARAIPIHRPAVPDRPSSVDTAMSDTASGCGCFPDEYGHSCVRIPLTRGQTAIVDDADYDELSRHKWCAQPKGRTYFAIRGVRVAKNSVVLVAMHTFLTGWSRVVHANGNGTDNRRGNLRLATASQTLMTMGKRVGLTSVYKGVRFSRTRTSARKWSATIAFNHRDRWLGRYESEIDAARAYDKAARKLFGEFAALNFPEPGERSALE